MLTFHAFWPWHYDDVWGVTETTWRSQVHGQMNGPPPLTPDERVAVLEAAFAVDQLDDAMPNDADRVVLLARGGEPVLSLRRRNFYVKV